MTKRIAAESEVKHGQTYWQIVDYDEEYVIAELGCYPDAKELAEEIVKRWDNAAKYKADADRLNITIVNLTEDLLYIAGIVEKGTGKPLDKNVPVTKQVLDYVKSKEADAERLAEALAGILDDADEYAMTYAQLWGQYRKDEQRAKHSRVDIAHAALKAHEELDGRA